jgi:predicted ATPase
VRAIEHLLSEHVAEHGLELFLRFGEIYQGWLLAEEGHEDDGIARIRHGLLTYEAAGAVAGTPTFLGILAGAYEKRGRPGEGLTAVTEALALCERTGTHYWDAELRRLRGALLLQAEPSRRRVDGSHGRDAEAESCFLEAIATARRQEAKSLELRAAMSLCRLWQQQGKTEPAHAMLSNIYGWFTEGFETPDLIGARALLAELEGGRRPA